MDVSQQSVRRRIAHDIVVDGANREIRIEGVSLPFHVLEDPEVVLFGEGQPAGLQITIIADNLTYISEDGSAKVLATGSARAESEWAKRRAQEIVYDGLRDVIEWLAKCEEKRQAARALSKAPYPTEGLDF